MIIRNNYDITHWRQFLYDTVGDQGYLNDTPIDTLYAIIQKALAEYGGEIVMSPTEPTGAISFKNPEDAIIFKLKYG